MARRESRLSVLYPGERQDVELFVSCQDLKVLDRFRGISPAVSIYIERNGQYELADSTERHKQNPSPDFKKSFNLEYFFAVKQHLKFIVTDANSDGQEKTVGEVYTSVGQIMGTQNQTIMFELKKDGNDPNSPAVGKLTIRGERLNYTSDLAKMTIKAKQLKVSRSLFRKPCYNFTLRLFRYLGEAGYGLIYESEFRKNQNPRWSEIQMKFLKLANGDYDRKIKAQIVNFTSSGNGKIVGECFFTVNDLLQNEALDYEIELISPKNNQKAGVLIVDSFDLIEKPHFLEYIQAGLQFNIMIGIDYTSSNGDPYTPESLHTIVDANQLNEYQKAMTSVCEILLNYDNDKKVLMYGFGGIPQYPQFKSELTSHCFPLTGTVMNPWADKLDGILKTYKSSFKHITFASPTYFEPVIRQAMQIARRNAENMTNEYTILLLLTDGKCHDMQDTINAILESAYLPLSIIIIGVGNADFRRMEILDGDDGLMNHKGEQAARDLVQFVPFRAYENNPDLLATNVLAEIPFQVVNYMLSQGIKPQAFAMYENPIPVKSKEYSSRCTGLVGEDSSEEYKDETFHKTTWVESTDENFMKALKFMKKENNSLYVNYVKDGQHTRTRQVSRAHSGDTTTTPYKMNENNGNEPFEY